MATLHSAINPTTRGQINELPFELDLSAVSDWIDNLPVTNQMETSRLVYSTLQSLNRHTFSPQLRFQILEVFRSVVLLQSKYLEKTTETMDFPLEQKTRKIAKLAAKFYVELATGYKHIANNSAFADDFSGKQQATVIHRAMQLISHSLLRIAQMYEPPSSRVWGEIKTLYLIAEKNGLLEIDVEDELCGNQKLSTINAIFKKTVLFTMSNPCCYSRQEMQNLFQLFEQRIGDVKIAPTPTLNDCTAAFVIDLENSYPPTHTSWVTYGNHLRFFFVDNLCKALARPDRMLSQRIGLNPTSLARFTHHLGSFNNPIPSKTYQEIEMTLGLENIVSKLASKTKQTPKLSALSTNTDWIEAPNYDLMPLNNNKPYEPLSVNNPPSTLTSKQDRIDGTIKPANIWATNQKQSLTAHHFKCEVQSHDLENHILVELQERCLPIGELIALHYPGKRNLVGIIRWQQPTSNDHYVFYGVEILANGYTLVDIIFESKKHSDILFLSDDQSTQRSIVMPPAKHRSGSPFTLRNQRETKNLRLKKLLETNSVFCHYSVSKNINSESSSS